MIVLPNGDAVKAEAVTAVRYVPSNSYDGPHNDLVVVEVGESRINLEFRSMPLAVAARGQIIKQIEESLDAIARRVIAEDMAGAKEESSDG